MVPTGIGRRVRRIAGAMLFAVAAGSGCMQGGSLGPDPEVAFLYLIFPGNDTVFVDVRSGVITSGPISTLTTSVDFSAEFFASNGTPDGRVVEGTYRLDVTPANTGIVTFFRSTSFAGTLNKVSAGSTEILFTLVHVPDAENLFARSVPITVN